MTKIECLIQQIETYAEQLTKQGGVIIKAAKKELKHKKIHDCRYLDIEKSVIDTLPLSFGYDTLLSEFGVSGYSEAKLTSLTKKLYPECKLPDAVRSFFLWRKYIVGHSFQYFGEKTNGLDIDIDYDEIKNNDHLPACIKQFIVLDRFDNDCFIGVFSKQTELDDSIVFMISIKSRLIYRVSNSFYNFILRGYLCAKSNVLQNYFNPSAEALKIIQNVDGDNVLPIDIEGVTCWCLDAPETWPDLFDYEQSNFLDKTIELSSEKHDKKPTKIEFIKDIQPILNDIDALAKTEFEQRQSKLQDLESRLKSGDLNRGLYLKLKRELNTFPIGMSQSGYTLETLNAQATAQYPDYQLPESVKSLFLWKRNINEDTAKYFGSWGDNGLRIEFLDNTLMTEMLEDYGEMSEKMRAFLVLGDLEGGYMLGMFLKKQKTIDGKLFLANLEDDHLFRVSNTLANFMKRGYLCAQQRLKQDLFEPCEQVKAIIEQIDGKDVLPNVDYKISLWNLSNEDHWPKSITT